MKKSIKKQLVSSKMDGSELIKRPIGRPKKTDVGIDRDDVCPRAVNIRVDRRDNKTIQDLKDTLGVRNTSEVFRFCMHYTLTNFIKKDTKNEKS